MRRIRTTLTILFAVLLFAGGLVLSAEAQTRRVTVRRPVQKPVVVRRVYYYNPYWRGHYWRYYDPFYADLYRSPYERYLEQVWYAERELAGNRRELAKHREEYGADGVITEKERRELDDDIRDVQKAQQRLNKLRRNY